MKNTTYKWLKIQNGKPYFAIVDLSIEKNIAQNEIIENYSGMGYSNHSIDVGINGAEPWKTGLRKGLDFMLSQDKNFWKININRLQGKPMTDTNPTIVGFVAILAFCEITNISLEKNQFEKIEQFVFSCWENGNAEKIPNFENLSFE